MHNPTLLLLAASLFVPMASLADSCYKGCGDVLDKPVFRTQTVRSGTKLRESFRAMLCTAEWRSYAEAQKAGIGVDLPIFDMVVPLDVNWDNSKREAWQKKSCSSEERKRDFDTTLYTTMYEVDPVTATAWTQCIKIRCKPEALICNLTETAGGASVVFEAKWRRSPGELDSAAPKIKSFQFKNTTCQTNPDMARGKTFGDAGVAVMCSQNLEIAPTFMLTTTRGYCSEATDLTKNEFSLSGKVVLTGPTTYKSPRLALQPDFKIVTNGYPLTISTSTLVLNGKSEIIAFEPDSNTTLGKAGRSADTVRIQAKAVNGAGLVITNFGEDGGKGIQGLQPEGRPPRAPQGTQRDWNLVNGCIGGSNGKPGVTGAQGPMGFQGARGGAAGEVILAIGSAGRDAIAVTTRRVARDGGTVDCGGMVCGGLGGAGGDGGPGQLGGLGGEGAPGTLHCGGTGPGADAGNGPPGPTGPEGNEGERALVKRF